MDKACSKQGIAPLVNAVQEIAALTNGHQPEVAEAVVGGAEN